MTKKTYMSPTKSAVKNHHRTPPSIRKTHVIIQDNHSIPDAKLVGFDNHVQLGRVPALDVDLIVKPILTSARKTPAKMASVDFDLDKVFTTRCRISDDEEKTEQDEEKETVVRRRFAQKKKDQDEEYKQPEEESESEDEEVDYEEDEDDHDLATDVNYSDSDDDDHPPQPDRFSPEKATGIIEYTIHDPEKGVIQNVRRASRLSFGSPAGKK